MNQSVYHAYLWTILLVAVVIAGVLFLTRNVNRPSEPGIKVA
jgi:HAMP domain-containing protein